MAHHFRALENAGLWKLAAGPEAYAGCSRHRPLNKVVVSLIVSFGRAAVIHCRNYFKTNTAQVFQLGFSHILEGTLTPLPSLVRCSLMKQAGLSLASSSKEGQQISRENGKTVSVETARPRQDVLSGVGGAEGTETIADNPWNATFQPPLVGGYGVGQQHATENVVLSPEQHICSICMNSQLSERSRRRQAPDGPVSAK